MQLKNRNATPQGGFTFRFNTPDGSVMSIRSTGLSQLTEQVKRVFRNLGMEIPDNLSVIVEHQICLNQSSPTTACWSSGIGDDLHHKWIAPFLNRIADVAAPSARTAVTTGVVSKVRNAVAKAVRKVAGCSSCKGTRTYKQGVNNLGRAGTLNKL